MNPFKLYDIDAAITELLDPETGEILDYEAFSSLSMERDALIENMALLLKNSSAMAEALGNEIKRMQARKKVMDNNVTRLKAYIEEALGGQKFESPRCSISYRKSEGTYVDAGFIEWAEENCPDVVIEQDPKIDANALKKLLKDGMECPFARIIVKNNVQVK